MFTRDSYVFPMCFLYSHICPIVFPCNFHFRLPDRIPYRLRSKARPEILGALDEAASRTCKNDEGIHSNKKRLQFRMQLLSVFTSFQHVLHLFSTCFLCLFSIFSRIFPIVVPCNFHTGLPERIPDRLRSKARLAILGALGEAASRTCKNDEGIHSTKK